MKRREFLSASAGVAGLLLNGVARSQSKPCPPGTTSVRGGSSVQTACPSGNLPSWVPVTIGQWVAIATSNTIASVQPSPTPAGNTGTASVTDAWGCIAASADGDVYLWGGGHWDYAGNEVYRLRLNQDSPAWQRLGSPSSSTTSDVKYYSDGNPSARHTYQSHWFAGGKLKSLGGAYNYGSSSVSPSNTDIFDPETATWQTKVNANGSHWYATGDHNTGVIYAAGPSGASTVRYIRMALDNTWTQLGTGSGSAGYFGGSAFDSARQRIYRIGDYDGGVPVTYWAVGSGEVNPSLTGTAASAFDSSGPYPGVDYDSGSDCIYLKDDGANRTVYRLNCSTFACDTFTTSGATPPAAASGAVCGRFKYIPDLKGFIYIPSWGKPYFLRTAA